ncbi:MAG: hypothetical protein ISS15_05325 [Alphaproteobacteria bacterium]|nr:hypothetical protein [Alphaproteobacteria bacterium]MBL6939459.1 hypothetical protein [Alphaproteobacteria bacterium]MBL7097060.1 hypothetical protein [Alphaproteobacteria bacterium]
MRTLSSATQTALAAGLLVVRALVNVYVDEGLFGFWNDLGTVSIGGVTYYGTGKLGEISKVDGVTNLSIPNFTVTLNGLDTDVLNDFFTYTWHQRPIQVLLALLDASRNLVDTPVVMASGRMDKAAIRGGGKQQSSLQLSCEDVSRRLSWVNPAVRSDADQRQRLSTDTFFSQVATTIEQQMYWGVKQPKPPHAVKSIRGITSPIT